MKWVQNFFSLKTKLDSLERLDKGELLNNGCRISGLQYLKFWEEEEH